MKIKLRTVLEVVGCLVVSAATIICLLISFLYFIVREVATDAEGWISLTLLILLPAAAAAYFRWTRLLPEGPNRE